MKKTPTNSTAHDIIKKHASSGSIAIFDIEDEKIRNKKILLFVEIEISDKDNEKIIQILKSELKEQFFNAPAQTDEYAFESALAKANIKVKDILLSKPKNWLNKIHVIAAALCNDEIYVAPVGRMHAFLIHNYKISDVLESPQSSQAPNPVKLFTNIVSGKLGVSNAIVLTNEPVLDYLSEERIRKFAHEYGPDEALEKLSELLSRAPENKQFGLAVIKRIYKQETEKEAVKNNIAKFSEPEKDEKEQDYQEEEKQNISRFNSSASKSAQILKKLKPYAQALITFILSMLLKLLEKAQKMFSKLVPKIGQAFKMLSIIYKNQRARTYHLSKIKNLAKQSIEKIKRIKLTKQIIVWLSVIILAAVFGFSITFKAKKNVTQEKSINTQNQTQQIEKKISEAQAALIYDNLSGALALAMQAESLLNELNSENQGNIENIDQIKSNIENIKNSSEKKKVIENIKAFINIIPAPISPSQTGLIAIEDALMFFDGVQEKIAKIDTDNQLLLTIPLESQGIESFNTAISLSDNTIAALKKDIALIIDTEKETIDKQKFFFDPSLSERFAQYSRNLYTFDANENQIIRYSRAGAGFTAAQNWLAQEYELSTIVDIEVDGFIYLIDTQGNIHTFLKGKFRSRLPWPVNEKPKDNIKLRTNENIDALYVLDSGNKRIVRMTKDGDLVEQIIAEEFKNATDILIDKGHENLYVLANDKIYKIQIAK